MIQLSFKYGNSADVSRNWRMSTRRPLKRTIEDTVNRVLDTGTVGDRKQTGRPAINFDIACSNVDLDVKKYPQSSQRDRARRLGLSQSMILRSLRKLHYHAYKLRKTIFLSLSDKEHRVAFCSEMMSRFGQDSTFFTRIFLSDECLIRIGDSQCTANMRVYSLKAIHMQ